MDVPIYVQCPTVFSCIIDDAWGLLDWRSIGLALLVWFVNISWAYKSGRSREMARLWLALKKSLVPTLVGWVLAFLFIALVYSPWQRYGALREYAKTLKETPDKIVYQDKVIYQDKPETVKELKRQETEILELKQRVLSLTQTNKFQNAAMRPNLNIAFYHNERGIGWRIVNSGPGHAVVKWFAVSIDGIFKPSWTEVTSALGVPRRYQFSNPASQIVPSADFELFWLEPETAKSFDERNRSRVRMEICYCSMIEGCWLSTNLTTERTKEHQCKEPPQITFVRY